MSGSAMGLELGISKGCVNKYMRNNGLAVSQELKNKFKTNSLKGKTTFTKAEDQFIKDNLLIMPIKTLAKKINRSSCGVRGRLKALNIHVPKELAAQRKSISMYRKGSIAHNKGKKQLEYMSAAAIEKTKATRFKAGERPPNSFPIGTIVERKEKASEKVYKYQVQAKGQMKLYHRIIWEKVNGKIPLGHCIWFLDSNPLNCVLENLELITRKENISRNTIIHYPKELKETIILRNKIKNKLNEQRKNTNFKPVYT